MEDLKVIERLDSLWFFTNAFSSSITKALSIVSDDDDEDERIKSEKPKSDPPKPTTPILQIHQTHSPIDAIVVEEIPKYGDFVAERSRASRETEEEQDKKERRIRKKRRLKGDLDQRRRVVNWLDFGFDLNEIDEFCMMMMMDGKSKACGYDDGGKMNGMMLMNMPSFSDEMAMREHLKSWAYSVACAVK